MKPTEKHRREELAMNTLILNSLEIRGFRGFRQLQVERLGRVNLIVGKNNVGKSSLLEALQLYAHRGSPRLIWELLVARDESGPVPSVRLVEADTVLTALKYLFYGRKDIKIHPGSIQIGPINSLKDTLSLSVGWYTEPLDKTRRQTMEPLQPEEYNTVIDAVPRFVIQMGRQPKTHYSLDPYALHRVPKELKEVNCVFTPANGLDRGQISELWDAIALTSMEKDVLAALGIIAPGVESLGIVKQGSIPIVKIAGIDDPLPIRSLGDGMLRAFSIVLALVNARDGILLIDEFENGIHYTALPDLWQLIFQVARRLNVQVFATTHSWDCIEGFQRAVQENNQDDGMLIRLEYKKGEVAVTLFDGRRLGIATRERIEVR
jgi:hypothetical protein